MDRPNSICASLKGQALLMAIDSGLVRFDKKADGYPLDAFLRFWDLLAPTLDALLQERQDVREALDHQDRDAADDRTHNAE